MSAIASGRGLATLVAGVLIAFLLSAAARGQSETDAEGFVPLFDGKTLEGWKANEHPDAFRVEEGAIVASGERSHLFYDGPVGDHDFKNFELKVEVKTEPGSNSGVYFHTEFQPEGWPAKGYECQVNNSQSDWRRTGSLYAIQDVRQTKAKDNEWFEYHIKVEGKKITVAVNGETTVEYTEPENPERPAEMKGRVLSGGTIALQAHDPGSTVRYRKLRIKLLP
ncbi:MAG TPA: DUF1080 domain-containing protein [Lacipirellulaceae bacterium]|nr:DUF1080 domain-containing protein [Lacipirellulaceae bacterium]